MKRFKLDRVIREYMVESMGLDNIDERYGRILQIAISGLRDINNSNGGVDKIVQLDINSNDTVLLPSDCIDVKTVGVIYGNNIIAIGYNPNLSPPSIDSCGDIQARSGGVVGTLFSPTTHIDSSGQFVGKYYGDAGGNNGIGYYKIFDDYIALNISSSYGSVVLKYIADIQSVNGQYEVHPDDVESLKAWIWWKYIQRNRNYPMGEKEMARRQYRMERKRAIANKQSLNLTDIVSALNVGYRPAPSI